MGVPAYVVYRKPSHFAHCLGRNFRPQWPHWAHLHGAMQDSGDGAVGLTESGLVSSVNRRLNLIRTIVDVLIFEPRA